MGIFNPINDDHAITSVVFTLALDEFVEPSVIAEIAVNQPWRDTLPAFSNLPAAQIAAAGQTFEAPAAQAAILRPDGRPIWALKFSGSEISVECTAYTRWEDVWSQAEGYLSQAWEIVKRHQNAVQVMEYRLAVNDQFRTEADTYDAAGLFNRGAEVLPERAFTASGVWHTNVGWVELFEDVRVFETVQVQARGTRAPGIETKGPFLFIVQHSLKAAFDVTPAQDLSRMDKLVREMHRRNKVLLGQVVNSEMLARIGLS